MDILLCDAGRRCARTGVRKSVAGARFDTERLQVFEERESRALSVGGNGMMAVRVYIILLMVSFVILGMVGGPGK